jgi:hypothetical protein
LLGIEAEDGGSVDAREESAISSNLNDEKVIPRGRVPE